MQRPRDAERTREAILNAATDEFARRGFAGARMDTIAERSGANKQLIYRYIGSKQELYQTVLRKILAERADTLRTRPAGPQDQVVHWFESALAHPWWIRFRQWEALEVQEGVILDDEKRREHFKAAVDSVEASQARGELSRELDSRLLLLLLSALAAYPLAFPHDTRLITGMPPTNELFVEAWTEFARQVVDRLKPHGAG